MPSFTNKYTFKIELVLTCCLNNQKCRLSIQNRSFQTYLDHAFPKKKKLIALNK